MQPLASLMLKEFLNGERTQNGYSQFHATLVQAGYSNRRIADVLGVDRGTVAKYRKQIQNPARDHHASARVEEHADDQQPPAGGLGQVDGRCPAATAILDRFLQSADVIEFKGRSYRLKQRGDKAELKAPRKKPSGEAEG